LVRRSRARAAIAGPSLRPVWVKILAFHRRNSGRCSIAGTRPATRPGAPTTLRRSWTAPCATGNGPRVTGFWTRRAPSPRRAGWRHRHEMFRPGGCGRPRCCSAMGLRWPELCGRSVEDLIRRSCCAGTSFACCRPDLRVRGRYGSGVFPGYRRAIGCFCRFLTLRASSRAFASGTPSRSPDESTGTPFSVSR